MLRQLEQAEKFIFLEFFIVEEGYMWGRILRVLERKVQEGVEVRMLYDGTCAVGKLPYRYPQELEALGTGALRLAAQEGDGEKGCFLAGQIAALVKKEQPAAQILREVAEEAEIILREASKWVS